MPPSRDQVLRALRRFRTRIADAAWVFLILGGILLFFWLIWSPPR